MEYALVKTKVSVVFYNASEHWRGKATSFLTRSNIHHCGLMLDREDKSVIMIATKEHSPRIIDTKGFHRLVKPLHIVYVGEMDVSIRQLGDFLYKGEKNTAMGLLLWLFVGRWLCKSNLPASCTLYVCQLLRICGHPIRNIIIPKELYKELTNAANTDSREGRSWEDYSSKDDS